MFNIQFTDSVLMPTELLIPGSTFMFVWRINNKVLPFGSSFIEIVARDPKNSDIFSSVVSEIDLLKD